MSLRRTARGRRRGSTVSARPSTRSWPSWPTPAACVSTSGSAWRCRRRSSRCWPCPAWGRARPATCGVALVSPPSTTSRRRHARAGCGRSRASASAPRRASSTASPSSRSGPRCACTWPRHAPPASGWASSSRPSRACVRCSWRVPCAEGARRSVTSTCWSRRTSRRRSSTPSRPPRWSTGWVATVAGRARSGPRCSCCTARKPT